MQWPTNVTCHLSLELPASLNDLTSVRFQVSKEEYDTCRITNPNPRIIAVCDKPYKLMFFTITFRSFTPQPGGLEFRPGQDYFFICKWAARFGSKAAVGSMFKWFVCDAFYNR